MNEGNKNRFVANGKQHVPELNYLQSIILITPQCACTYWAEPSICVCRFKYLYLRFCSAQAHSYCCSFDNKEEVSECAHICVSVSDIKCLCWSIRFCFFFVVLALLKQKFTDLPGRPAHLLRVMCACVRACKCRVLLCPATRKNRMTTTIIIIIIISSQLYHFSISSSAAAVVALGI